MCTVGLEEKLHTNRSWDMGSPMWSGAFPDINWEVLRILRVNVKILSINGIIVGAEEDTKCGQ